MDDEGDALGGAAIGALAGAAAGASKASDTREAIVLNCLRGRGHAVVELREGAMHDIQIRMTGLHHLLTGAPRQPTWRCTYPPVTSGAILAWRRVRRPRRSLPARLFRWW